MTATMDTAPRDGTEIVVTTQDGARVRCRWTDGHITEDGQPCGGWAATTDDYPESWTAGICWSSNADGTPSDQPVAWEAAR